MKHGGSRLFKRYSSLPQILQAVYPEHTWQTSRFVESGNTPRGYWKDKDNLLQVLAAAEEKLGIKQVNNSVS